MIAESVSSQSLRARLRAVRLYLIMDARPRVTPLEEFLARSIQAGVGMVQLREKQLNDAELLATARRCAAVSRRLGALFIVNDRLDVALAAQADGVHVGQDDLPIDDIRALAGEQFIVGLSTHSPAQIAHAQSQAADYVGVGPVHETPTKPGRPAVGLELVRYAAANSDLPFFAIGGLDPGNVADAVAAGARGISVLRCVTQAEDPAAIVRALIDQIPAGGQPA